MQQIISELEKFAGMYKNCDSLAQKLYNDYDNYDSVLKPPILLIMASGFLYNTKSPETLIDDHPHLQPLKKSIMDIVNDTQSTNRFTEIARAIVLT